MDDLKKLRRRVAEERRQGCGQRGKRYSVELRRDVSAYLRAARARGESPNRLGPALGLTLPTAYQWSPSPRKKEKGKAKPFRRMTIVAQRAARSARRDGSSESDRGDGSWWPDSCWSRSTRACGAVEEVGMLTPSRSRRVFEYQQPCDMRKQFDSLAAQVTNAMGHDILSGDLCLFVGRTKTRAKV